MTLFSTLWSAPIDEDRVREALRRTVNITAREGPMLVGCTRILTDGYLFATLAEIIVHPRYAGLHVGRRLIELAEAASTAGLCFGSQTVSDELMSQLGWTRGPHTFFKRDRCPRVRSRVIPRIHEGER